jgi:transcription antitermination protein NusB
MINRRNIRIKVMQLLYVIDANNDPTAIKSPVGLLQKNFDKTRELFVYLLHTMLQVALYSEVDSKHRAAKNITHYDDLNVNTKIAGNIILWQILEEKSYISATEILKPQLFLDKDIVRKLYQTLLETDEYKLYVSEQSRDKKSDLKILSHIFNFIMLPSELYTSDTEDRFANWQDDIEMLQNIVNTFLGRVQSIEMIEMLDDEKWQFAKNLLTTCIDKNEYLMTLIKPKLNNWDSDRIPALDLAIILMGLSELLYFETIPTKVTINEYIDLAKEYSTAQSGQFINGILDGMHKELMAQGKINKVDFTRIKKY